LELIRDDLPKVPILALALSGDGGIASNMRAQRKRTVNCAFTLSKLMEMTSIVIPFDWSALQTIHQKRQGWAKYLRSSVGAL
jgi:hypothetical protein